MRWFINILFLLALVIGLPYFLFRMATAGKYRRGLRQRFGNVPGPTSGKPVIWVHAVSVGEAQLAKPLIDGLRKQHPEHEIVISHTTRTAEEVTSKLYPDLQRFYSPLDLSWVVAKVMGRINPSLIVLIELELWPNFLLEAKRRGTPVLLANARISERSATGYSRHAWFFRGPFRAITAVAAQNDEYAARMKALLSQMKLDSSIVEVSGNLKYDNVPTERDDSLRHSYRTLFGLKPDELLLVAGSTHPGEHEILLKLYRRWRQDGLPLRLVVVPRHPERWAAVRELWQKAGIALADRSKLTPLQPLQPFSPPAPGSAAAARALSAGSADALPACVLFDVMGELGRLYHAADLAFIGGSLIPHGGQNMIEPAGLGVAVLYGPNTKNFRTTVAELEAARGGITVANADQLYREVLQLGRDANRREQLGNAGRAVVAAGRGATARHLEAASQLLK